MRRHLTALILASGLAIASPAMAQSSQKFENSLGVPVDSVKVEVSLSEALAYLADNPSKELGKRRHSFGEGNFGEKDLDRLVQRLESRLTKRLEKAGVNVDENSANTLMITLTDVKNNRPTMGQMSGRPSLSYRSVGAGGASFEGKLITENGEAQGDISYAWYESFDCDFIPISTWGDTNRAIDRFARHTAKSMKWN